MAEIKLPVVDEGVSVSDAFETLKKSGRSGLLVRHHDGMRLYRAETLDLQLHGHSDAKMSDIVGGDWLRQTDGAKESAIGEVGFIFELSSERAKIGGLSDGLAHDLNLAVHIYSCSKSPTAHIYTPAQYRALPVVNGIRYCSTKDGGNVT